MNSRIVNLMYHDIYQSDILESGFNNKNNLKYKIKKSEFKKQISFLVKSGIQFVLTFDDGGSSFIKEIAPILEQHKLKGIFCIATKYINTNGFLTSSDIFDLHKRGHLIASHSHIHSKDMSVLDYNELLNEWSVSRRILTKIIKEDVTIASIPNGFDSPLVFKSLLKSGYTTIYTSKPTTNININRGLEIRGRYAITSVQSFSLFKKIVANPFYRLLFFYKWIFLSSIKKILGKKYLKIRSVIKHE